MITHTPTVRIDATRYDFTQVFPPPDDAAVHRAGRQGILDQKEDASLSDAAWLALQHDCWLHELIAYGELSSWLVYCLDKGLDPASGEAPRSAAKWAALQTRMQGKLTHCRHQRTALLEDYARYFGCEAAQHFDNYAQAHCRCVVPAQESLF
jgi:hypothetical protein